MPILPRIHDVFPDDPPAPWRPLLPGSGSCRADEQGRRERSAPADASRWIPDDDERMLGDDVRAIARRGKERLIVSVRPPIRGASIELEDIDLDSP